MLEFDSSLFDNNEFPLSEILNDYNFELDFENEFNFNNNTIIPNFEKVVNFNYGNIAYSNYEYAVPLNYGNTIDSNYGSTIDSNYGSTIDSNYGNVFNLNTILPLENNSNNPNIQVSTKKSVYRKKSTKCSNPSKFEKSNRNPTQSNIHSRLIYLYKFFQNKDFVNQATFVIANEIVQSDQFLNLNLTFPNIDDLIKNLINQLPKCEDRFSEFKIIEEFILNLTQRFESENQDAIQKYAKIIPTEKKPLYENYSYIFPISDCYLYQLKLHSLKSNRIKMIENSLFKSQIPYYKILEENKGLDFLANFNSIKNSNKDSKISTDHLGFNLFLSLFLNIFHSINERKESNDKSWKDFFQCPHCNFMTNSHENRGDNGEKNSLVKHIKTCPGIKVRPKKANQNNDLFPPSCVFRNAQSAMSLS